MSILGNVQRVLALFAAGATDLSFTEAATLLELPKSSTSHLLNQMVRYGLLDQHSTTRRYRPGALLGQAAHAAYVSSDFDDACREVLERLSARSGLTAYLSTLSGRETVVLQRLNGSFPVQVLSSPGSRRDATGTAMGRALLSRLAGPELAELFGTDGSAPLASPRQSGFARVDELLAGLASVAQARHAMVVDGAMPDIGAIAAAVRNPLDGELRGLCISFVPRLQPGADQIEGWRRLVLEETSALGRRIGDPFWRAVPAVSTTSSITEPTP